MRLSRLSRNYSFADKCVLTSQNTDVLKFPFGNFLPPKVKKPRRMSSVALMKYF